VSATTSSTPERLDQVDVLALIDHFVLGGAETMLARFALAAPAAGIRVHTACLTELDGNPAAEPLARAGQPVVNLDLGGRPSLASLRALRSHIREINPSLVHTHLGSSDFLGPLAARSLGIPSVSTIHTTQWSGRLRYRTMRRITQSCVSRVIAVSDSARQEFLKLGFRPADHLVTINNGIDLVPVPGEGAVVRRELGLREDDLVVMMISALREEKGHDVALQAVRELRSRVPNLRLVIAGQGLLKDEIERSGRDLGDAIVMAGLRADVMRLLDAADVCIHPSRRDAFPNTIIEAMAARVPVIATRTGGIPEILPTPDLGTLIPAPPQPGELAGALGRLLEDPGRRGAQAEAAHRRYVEKYTAERWVKRTRALYDEVLTEADRRRSRPRTAPATAVPLGSTLKARAKP
jgi:glycosyltransferase involved in cell wall biosynthesis